MRLKLPYGGSFFDLELPRRNRLKIAGNDYPPPLKDPKTSFIEAIENPVGSSGLGGMLPPGGRISVLVSDLTRGGVTGGILAMLLEYMEGRGVGADRVGVFLSMGMHRGHDRGELERLLGAAILSKYKVTEHNASDECSNIEVGTTPAGTLCLFNKQVVESDLVIGIGTISFHYFAGFGGARKLILPGISSEKTILANHRLSLMEDPGDGLAEHCRPGNLENNPVHEDMVEGAKLLPAPAFMINTFCAENGEAAFINAGDMVGSHEAAAAKFHDEFTIPLDKRYKAVISSAGGFPKDINLLQAHKALRHSSYAVDDGGVLLIAAACPEGMGSKSLSDSFGRGRDLVPVMVREGYTLNSQTAMSIYDITGRVSIYLRSDIPDREVERFGFCPWRDDYTGFLLEGIDDDEVLVIMNAASFLPVALQ